MPGQLVTIAGCSKASQSRAANWSIGVMAIRSITPTFRYCKRVSVVVRLARLASSTTATRLFGVLVLADDDAMIGMGSGDDRLPWREALGRRRNDAQRGARRELDSVIDRIAEVDRAPDAP